MDRRTECVISLRSQTSERSQRRGQFGGLADATSRTIVKRGGLKGHFLALLNGTTMMVISCLSPSLVAQAQSLSLLRSYGGRPNGIIVVFGWIKRVLDNDSTLTVPEGMASIVAVPLELYTVDISIIYIRSIILFTF